MSRFHPTYEELMKGLIDVFITKNVVATIDESVERHRKTMRRHIQNLEECETK